MKKVTILLFMVCFVLPLTGCKFRSPQITPSAQMAVGYTFCYDGVSIAMHAEAEPILTALGEPNRCTEQASCAFEGLDKTYVYDSFSITTYPKDGKDYISGLWFTDGQVSTGEGIGIGDSQARVEEIYGRDARNGSNAYVLDSGDMKLTIILADGVVSSVQYGAVLE